jgi:MFS family permease
MCLGLLIAVWARGWPVLMVGRALQGLGGGALITLAFLGIRRGYPESLRPRMMAIVSSSWVLPSLIGPLAAGALAERASWRWVFAMLLPLAITTVALMLPATGRLPPPRGKPAKGRMAYSALLAATLGILLASLEALSAWTVPAVTICLAFAVVFARRILPRGTLRLDRGLPAGLAFRTLLSFVFFGAEAFVPLGLSLLRGYSPTAGGLVLTAASLSWVAGSWTQAKLDERFGPRTRPARMLGGILLVAFGIVGMAAAMITLSVPSGFSTLGWAIAGLGMGIAYPTTSVFVLDRAAPGEEGWISSSLNLVENVGIALGAGFGGAVYGIARSAELEPALGIALTFATVLSALPLGLLAASRVRTSEEAGGAKVADSSPR